MRPASNRMRLLFDQNVPQSVIDFFAERGHEVQYSRDVLQQNSPDNLIAIAGALEGLIVFTNDKDFKRFREMFPQGFRAPAWRLFGRINMQVEPSHMLTRLIDVIDLIEAHHANAE